MISISSFKAVINNPSFKLSFYYLLVIGSLKAIQFSANSFLAVTLPITEFGFFSMLSSYQVAAATFGSIGIIESLSGQLKNNNVFSKGDKVIFRKFTFLLILLSSLTLFFFLIVIYFSNYKSSFFYLYVLSLLVGLIISYSNIQSYFFRLNGLNFKSLFSNSIISLLYYTLVLILATYIDKVNTIVLYSSFGVFLFFILLNIFNFFYRPIKLDISEVFFYFKNIFPYIIIGFFGWISGYGINILINELIGLKIVALFTFLLTVSTLVQLVSSSLNVVWGPKFYSYFLNDDLILAESKNKKFYQIQIVFLSLLIVLILLIYKKFSNLIPNDLYQNRLLELALLQISFIINIPWVHCSNYYFISNYGNKLMKKLLFTGIVGILIWVYFIYLYGEIGVFLGFTINTFLKSFIIWIDSRNYWLISNLWVEIILASGLIILFTSIIK